MILIITRNHVPFLSRGIMKERLHTYSLLREEVSLTGKTLQYPPVKRCRNLNVAICTNVKSWVFMEDILANQGGFCRKCGYRETKKEVNPKMTSSCLPSHKSTRGAKFPDPWATEEFQFHRLHHEAVRGWVLTTSTGKSIGLGGNEYSGGMPGSPLKKTLFLFI